MKELIKKIRRNNGMTQSELGNILGVSRNVIAQIEIGKNKPTIQLLEKMSEKFNIPLDKLIAGDVLMVEFTPGGKVIPTIQLHTNLSLEDNLFLNEYQISLNDLLDLLLTLCAILRQNGYVFSDEEIKELEYYESIKYLVSKLLWGEEKFNDEIKKHLINIKNNSLHILSKKYTYELQKKYNFYVTEVEELRNPPIFPIED